MLKATTLLLPVLLWPGFALADPVSHRIHADMVPDEATAIKVASAVLEGYLGEKEFRAIAHRRPLRAIRNGDNWEVTPYPRDENCSPEGMSSTVCVVTGGGDPALVIAKSDGQILDLFFQR